MHTIQGMQLSKAKSFLKDVTDYKQAVPFTMFTGGVGRHAAAPGAPAECAWPLSMGGFVF